MNREIYIEKSCSGCGLCHSINGTVLKRNKKGFIVPVVDGDIYEKICPVYYYEKQKEFFIWGEYINTYEGYSLDNNIRYEASSGGVLTTIAIYLLENNIVDAVIQTGMDKENPQETKTYVSTTRDQVIENMGSRYSISVPLMNILQLLQKSMRYAFIGKPCDVTALKRYMQINSELKEQIVITLSFFCAGMPSNISNNHLLKKMGVEKEALVSFQYRGNGWPGYTTAIDKNGQVYQIEYNIAWGDYLGRDVNTICRYCMDGIGESADISCADLWYLNEDNKPDFSEHEGRNIIFSRTPLAENIIYDMAKRGIIYMNPFTNEMQNFKDYQPYQFSRRVTMKYCLLALKLFGRYSPKYNKHLVNNANKYATCKMNWKIFRGTVKRILQGKL